MVRIQKRIPDEIWYNYDEKLNEKRTSYKLNMNPYKTHTSLSHIIILSLYLN